MFHMTFKSVDFKTNSDHDTLVLSAYACQICSTDFEFTLAFKGDTICVMGPLICHKKNSKKKMKLKDKMYLFCGLNMVGQVVQLFVY